MAIFYNKYRLVAIVLQKNKKNLLKFTKNFCRKSPKNTLLRSFFSFFKKSSLKYVKISSSWTVL